MIIDTYNIFNYLADKAIVSKKSLKHGYYLFLRWYHLILLSIITWIMEITVRLVISFIIHLKTAVYCF